MTQLETITQILTQRLMWEVIDSTGNPITRQPERDDKTLLRCYCSGVAVRAVTEPAPAAHGDWANTEYAYGRDSRTVKTTEEADDVPEGFRELREDEKNRDWIEGARYLSDGEWGHGSKDLDGETDDGAYALPNMRIIAPIQPVTDPINESAQVWTDSATPWSAQQVRDLLAENSRLRENLEKMSHRDGKWVDEWGACRVCGGEIPDGHTNTCDYWQLEKALKATQTNEPITITIERPTMNVNQLSSRCGSGYCGCSDNRITL